MVSSGLDAQLIGDGHDHFEDGHEGGDLAEVAAADHLGVDLQAPLVVLARHTAADLVEPVQDVVRKLRDRQHYYMLLCVMLCLVKSVRQFSQVLVPKRTAEKLCLIMHSVLEKSCATCFHF